MKQTFEDFLMEKHAEDYVGTKDCMVDDFNEWVVELGADDFIYFGDMFAKEQSKDLLEACKEVADRFEKIPGEDKMLTKIRQAIAKGEEV